jgi:predicted P-loop ATPase
MMSAPSFTFGVHQIVGILGGDVTGADSCNVPGPGHSAKDRSLSIKIDPAAPDGFLVYSHAGDNDVACKDYVRDRLGLPQWSGSGKANPAGTDYVYKLADGTPYLRVRRTADKRFWQQKWDGKEWVNGAPKGPKIPYRLPELLAAEHDDVFIAEGEKDVENLVKRGFVATTNAGGAKKWSSDLNSHFAGKNVYILPDNDDVGFDHARIVSTQLLPLAQSIHIVNLPDLPPKGDVSDWFKAGGTADQLADLARQTKPVSSVESAAESKEPEPATKQASNSPQVDQTAKADLSWRFTLICTRFGTPKALLANVVIVLRNAECWRGVLAFDQFAYRIMLLAAPPWQLRAEGAEYKQRVWTEQDDLAATHWLQTVEGITVAPAVTAQAVELVARDHTYHPVRDYVRSREWDGKDRLATMLSTYFGAEQSAYTEAVGRMVMISAVARIVDPGCQVDTMLILEGEQGLMKSTAIKALFSPWFTDEIEQLGTKDASMQVAGVWGIEIGELDAMSRTEVSNVKAFITRRIDRFRPPYGRRVLERPRECIFIGTTNTNDYLKDPTGARRFLPVIVTKVGLEALLADRDQLWAEARVLYEKGTPWWFTEAHADAAATARQEQEARYQEDAWEEPIADYLESRLHRPPDDPAYRITIERVFKDALDITDKSRWDQRAKNTVARCLKRLGWKKKQVRVTLKIQAKSVSKPRWFYVREPTGDELLADAHMETQKVQPLRSESTDGNVTSLRAGSSTCSTSASGAGPRSNKCEPVPSPVAGQNK